MVYLHDFQCPICHNCYNRIWASPLPGRMWCKLCNNVECPHDQTFALETYNGVVQPVSRYDRQIVVKLTNTKNYSAVDNAGTALHNKATSKGLASQIIELNPEVESIGELKREFQQLTSQSRLYLVGHGQGDKMQGLYALNLAYAVAFNWGVTAVARITLVSCETGQSTKSVFNDNFAQQFHSYLWKPNRLRTVVAAYRKSVSVATATFAAMKAQPQLEGKKTFFRDEHNLEWMADDHDQVKVVWYWDGETQRSRTRSQDRQ